MVSPEVQIVSDSHTGSEASQTLSRPVAGVLVTESAVLGVYVKRLKREERSGELELSTGCHARAKSCDADVTTNL
jgi:hypothetical protein